MTITARVEELRRRHANLQKQIETALQHPATDDLEIVELKKQKLRLKEEIERLAHA